jgi:Fic family protein
MRSFQRPDTLDPVPGAIVAALRTIDRAAGAEARYADQLPQLLDALREQARIESITASSAIEGVIVDERRVAGLVSANPSRFKNRSEAEFAGYTAAQDYLQHDDPGALSVGLILHLHRLLFSFVDGGGGRFKLDDNLVVDRNADGTKTIRFEPVPATHTENYTVELVARTNTSLDDAATHPLLTIAAFGLDLLCIHPFADGNGRVTRLLTAHLMQRAGYGVGRYVAVEQLIFETKDDYYDTLAASTTGWFDDGTTHSVWPWAGYFLDRIAEAYERFADRVAAGTSAGTKQDRIRDYVLLHAPAQFTIADIRRAVPGISDNTIRLVLTELKAAGKVTVDGTGRGTTWSRT